MYLKHFAKAVSVACLMATPAASETFDPASVVAAAMEPSVTWDVPKDGASAVTGKTIVYLAANLRNSGILAVAEGVREAAQELDWTLDVIDARGDAEARAQTLQALLQDAPDGLILGGFNATDHSDLLWELREAGTQIVGWHAASSPGAIPGTPVLSNVTTDPLKVAQVAAAFAIEATGRQAGAVIFTDTRFGIAVAKSDEMARVIHACATCEVLEVIHLRLDRTAEEMPKQIKRLQEVYGDRWNVSLGINDLYFDDAIIELSFSDPDAASGLFNISAGDGSVSAYQRIESKLFQAATVPEPLNFQGWQIMDALNRSFAGLPQSDFIAPTKLVTAENVHDDGGKEWHFEPENGYRDTFREIWGQ